MDFAAAVTVTSHDAVRVTPSFVTDAVIVAEPAATPVTVPDDTVALVVSDDFHVTVDPAGVTVAVNVVVASAATVAVDLSNVIVGTVPLPDPSTKTTQFSAGSVKRRVSTW